MKRILGFVLCSVFLLATAGAQQSTDSATPSDLATKEDIQRMFDVMQARRNADAMFNNFKQQIPSMISSVVTKQLPNATAEQKAQMDAFITDMMQKVYSNVPFEEMLQAQIPIYQRHFTRAEIQQMIQFYSSPVGQKFLTEMPTVVSESMQASFPIMQKWISSKMAEVQKSAEEYAKSMKEKPPASEPLKESTE
jgi:hypothetical protein